MSMIFVNVIYLYSFLIVSTLLDTLRHSTIPIFENE